MRAHRSPKGRFVAIRKSKKAPLTRVTHISACMRPASASCALPEFGMVSYVIISPIDPAMNCVK